MFETSRTRPVRRAENLAAICEPIVYTSACASAPLGAATSEALSSGTCRRVVRRRFAGTYLFHLQGLRMRGAGHPRKISWQADFQTHCRVLSTRSTKLLSRRCVT
jgi:hypothetical protein